MFYDESLLLNLLMDYVDRLSEVEQSTKYHPEGNVLNHTLQVTKWAFKEGKDEHLLVAALLHDIGKYQISHGHEDIAVEWLMGKCSSKTLWLIKNHIKIRYYLSGVMKKASTCRDLYDHKWFKELTLLHRWDSMGRSAEIKLSYDRDMIIERILKVQKSNTFLQRMRRMRSLL